MQMTHYMELLATNQPWNLILFMAIPVILAETIAVTELYILFEREKAISWIRNVNKIAGLVVGFYFMGVFVYLIKNAVIPLTSSNEWRGIADIIAVGAYLAGVIPLFGISLVEMGFLGKNKSPSEKLKIHAMLVGLFLIVAHIAMIFGMLNPHVLGWSPKVDNSTMQMEMQ